jgi:hypothetical protein
MWFLGLYQHVQGIPMGNLASLAPRAWNALWLSAALAAISYGLAWRWCFLRSAEAIEGPVRAIRTPDWVFRFLDATVLRAGFDRATFRFLARTVARSDRHSAAFATISGIGVTMAFLSLVSPSRWTDLIPLDLLNANFILIYALLTGLRVSFGIPADPAASWIFRIAAHPDADPCSLVRRTLWCFASPLIAAPAAFFAFRYGMTPALLHLLFATLCTAGLIDLLAAGFRAVPFTCSWLPGRNNLIFAIAGWFAGLVVFGPALAGLDHAFLRAPGSLLVTILIFAGIFVFVRRGDKSREKVAWADTRDELDLLRLTE